LLVRSLLGKTVYVHGGSGNPLPAVPKRRGREEGFVQYEEFLNKVQERIGLAESDEARRAITATFSTLCERISGGEASDLADQLPQELKEPLQRAGEDAEEFSLEEFLRRVGEREGVNTDAAREHVSAVMTVLREAVTGGELDDIRAQLPQEFQPLFEYGR
jgi:uncharacterized protein (DUF2267 family)